MEKIFRTLQRHISRLQIEPRSARPKVKALMEIYLLTSRHRRGRYPDSERALTDEGKEKLRRVLKRARGEAFADPDQPVSARRGDGGDRRGSARVQRARSSERRRSRRTDRPTGVWEEIRARRNEDAILLASHEPLMSATVAVFPGLAGLHVDMKKAALVRIDVDRFGPQPLGVLKWMLVPSVCRGVHRRGETEKS